MADIPIPTARDWMSADYMALSADMDLLDAIGRMADHAVTAGLVVDQDDKLEGILTEKDCLRILSMSTFHEAQAGKVRDFMSPILHCVEPAMDIFRTAALFLSTNFPVLPVVEGGCVIGQISRQNILRAIRAGSLQLEAEQKLHARRAKEAVHRPRGIQHLQRVFARRSRDQLVRLLKRKG